MSAHPLSQLSVTIPNMAVLIIREWAFILHHIKIERNRRTIFSMARNWLWCTVPKVGTPRAAKVEKLDPRAVDALKVSGRS